VNDPAGNPGVTLGGALVFFDTAAALSPDDTDLVNDLYVYDPATCSLDILSGDLEQPAGNATSSDDGSVVAFEVGSPSEITLLDRASGTLTNLGPGMSPDLSADGTRLASSRPARMPARSRTAGRRPSKPHPEIRIPRSSCATSRRPPRAR
jgi:hypothetical protein